MSDTDLEIALSIIQMRTPQRNEQGEEDYFDETYSVDVESLRECLRAMLETVSAEEVDWDSEEYEQHWDVMWTTCSIYYELGRTHEQMIQDGVDGL
jgi:hypothetical protein